VRWIDAHRAAEDTPGTATVRRPLAWLGVTCLILLIATASLLMAGKP
jgi:hypothetical protein